MIIFDSTDPIKAKQMAMIRTYSKVSIMRPVLLNDMDLSVRKIEAVEMASPNTTRTSEPRNEITKKKTLSFSVDRLLKSSNSSEDSKLEGMKQFCNNLLQK